MNGLHCACTGRLGGDPDLRYTRGGTALLALRVAVDENSQATEARPAPETQWVRVVVWGDQAEQLAGQLHKGSAVYIEGRLRLDRWQDRTTGEPRSGLAVSAWRVDLHGAIGQAAPRPGGPGR